MVDRAVCRCSLEVPGGSDRRGKGQRPRVGLPAPDLESMRQSLHGPLLEPVGHCSWLWRDGSKPWEAEY